MKKIYFAPETVVVNVELQQMIANSPGETILTPGTSEEEIESSEGIGSRGGFWSDED